MSFDTSQITNLALVDLVDLIASKKISPVEITKAYLHRIEETDHKIGAFITITGEQALEKAQISEDEILKDGIKSPLHGIPFATKDIFWTKGVRTTSGSLIDSDFIPDRDSFAVELLQNAGAHSIGKAHTVEYAFDPTGRNEHYPTPHNPWRHGHYTGGSSSGSGAAVAAGMAPLALGSDTGGSVRVPSSFCGITGLKPTFGLISRSGVTPLSWTLDTVGPMAHDAIDLAVAMNALVKHDPDDPASVKFTSNFDYSKGINTEIKGIKIGVPDTFIDQLVDNEVKDAFNKALSVYEQLGAEIEKVEIPELSWGEMGSVIISTEAATIHRDRINTSASKFDQRVRLRIETGFFVPAATYIKAQQVRSLLGKRLANFYKQYDLIAMPTTVTTAPVHDETLMSVNGKEVNTRETVIRHTSIFNQNGLPALSAPCGFSALGLPIGMMLVGRAFEDATVLRAAHAFQQATDWHKQRPSL